SDKNGNKIINPVYDKIRINQDKTVSGLLPREWKVIDGQNNFIQKLEFDTLTPLSESLLLVKSGDLEALADKKGALLTSLKSWQLYPLPNKYFIARENERYGILNAGGKVTIPIIYDTLFVGKEYLIGKYSDK